MFLFSGRIKLLQDHKSKWLLTTIVFQETGIQISILDPVYSTAAKGNDIEAHRATIVSFFCKQISH